MSLTKYGKTCEQDVKKDSDLKLTLEERERRESQSQKTPGHPPK